MCTVYSFLTRLHQTVPPENFFGWLNIVTFSWGSSYQPCYFSKLCNGYMKYNFTMKTDTEVVSVATCLPLLYVWLPASVCLSLSIWLCWLPGFLFLCLLTLLCGQPAFLLNCHHACLPVYLSACLFVCLWVSSFAGLYVCLLFLPRRLFSHFVICLHFVGMNIFMSACTPFCLCACCTFLVVVYCTVCLCMHVSLSACMAAWFCVSAVVYIFLHANLDVLPMHVTFSISAYLCFLQAVIVQLNCTAQLVRGLRIAGKKEEPDVCLNWTFGFEPGPVSPGLSPTAWEQWRCTIAWSQWRCSRKNSTPY